MRVSGRPTDTTSATALSVPLPTPHNPNSAKPRGCLPLAHAPRSQPSHAPPSPLCSRSSPPCARPRRSLPHHRTRHCPRHGRWVCVPWHLRSSPAEPRAPTSVAGACALPLAAGSHAPMAEIDRFRAFPPLCCICMFQVFQMFWRYVASVSYGCCKSRSVMLQ
jgi:hypothetical protein